MSEELKIKNIHFLGNTNEVEKELCHSDIFVLPKAFKLIYLGFLVLIGLQVVQVKAFI